MSRLGILVALPLFASTAYAQAPGEVTPTDPQPETADPYQGPSATPVAQPAVVPVDPCGGCGGRDVMRHRFAVGINFGGMSVSDPDSVDAAETDFNTAELSLRFRATPHFELELLLSGGREVLDDSTDGDLAMGGGTLAARYRFRPERAWNWWLMGGLGATVIEQHTADKDARDAATRPHVAFGVGLERRFRRLALHADLRVLALGERKDQTDAMTTPVPDGPVRPPLDPVATDVRTAQQLSAGQLTLGASFYF